MDRKRTTASSTDYSCFTPTVSRHLISRIRFLLLATTSFRVPKFQSPVGGCTTTLIHTNAPATVSFVTTSSSQWTALGAPLNSAGKFAKIELVGGTSSLEGCW